ncbi:MAG: hypothetical protein KIT09_29945 [Bryobacteraceae bacterium]|nr:hypothetical protein [Bryobacteraceae bacterium]
MALISYRSVVMNRLYRTPYADLVTGALTAYDLPDLAACLAPRRLLIVNPKDQLLASASAGLIEKEFSIVRAAFSKAGAASSFVVRSSESLQPLEDVFSAWPESQK